MTALGTRTLESFHLDGYTERTARQETVDHAQRSECAVCGVPGLVARVFYRAGAGVGIARIFYACNQCGHTEEV